MSRYGLAAMAAALTLVLAGTQAHAQFFFQDEGYWRRAQPGAAARYQSYQPPRRASRQQQRSWWDDDDDEDERPRRRAQGPDKIEGGPRPQISAAAPPVIPFKSSYKPGSIVIDTGARALYFVLPSNRAYRYRIAVGREGFSWTGTQKISRKVAWPDWRPPEEMRERDPRLPKLMTGGVNNPLGAKALYLGSTLYRIHGTNNASSIGTASSSGCFRMTNANVTHLAAIAGIGASVHVLRSLPASVRSSVASRDTSGSRAKRRSSGG